MKTLVTLKINEQTHELAVGFHRTLLDVLREELNLTGTQRGCDLGECGSCTVLMDGKPVNSCLVLAVQAQGHEIVTIEGLSRGNRFHPLQQAFVDRARSSAGFARPA